MPNEIKRVIDEVNEIRGRIAKGTDATTPAFLADLRKQLESSEHLRHQPVVRAFIEDLRADDRADGPAPRLLRTKKHINTERDHHLFSLFNASYFPRLSLDYLTYETLPTDPHLARRYGSNTMPVNITACSDGFDSRVVVALFPIDKFVERHNRITRTMIDEVMAPGSPPVSVSRSPWWSHWGQALITERSRTRLTSAFNCLCTASAGGCWCQRGGSYSGMAWWTSIAVSILLLRMVTAPEDASGGPMCALRSFQAAAESAARQAKQIICPDVYPAANPFLTMSASSWRRPSGTAG
ncbi:MULTISPECIES: hypothetical protein [Streptomyces]|uniref:hypothetical protein n=1 Tax=Streptomyces TaxID=1883 RepID=UPI001925B977|nr:hypothetical protein [Streptomyces sp. SID685]